MHKGRGEMKKYISGFDNLDASLMLLEILEIKNRKQDYQGNTGKGCCNI